MANKREFKKYINAVAASVCEDMMIVYYNSAGVDKEKVENSIGKVLAAAEEARTNANTRFERTPGSFDNSHEYGKARLAFTNALFDKVNKDFRTALDEAIKEFNSAIPAGDKAANKAAATE